MQRESNHYPQSESKSQNLASRQKLNQESKCRENKINGLKQAGKASAKPTLKSVSERGTGQGTDRKAKEERLTNGNYHTVPHTASNGGCGCMHFRK